MRVVGLTVGAGVSLFAGAALANESSAAKVEAIAASEKAAFAKSLYLEAEKVSAEKAASAAAAEAFEARIAVENAEADAKFKARPPLHQHVLALTFVAGVRGGQAGEEVGLYCGVLNILFRRRLRANASARSMLLSELDRTRAINRPGSCMQQNHRTHLSTCCMDVGR